MCGGLAIAAGQNTRGGPGGNRLTDGLQMLIWQLGRVGSYGLMGLIAGGFGGFFLSLGPVELTQRVAMVLANLLLMGLGLHLARVSSTRGTVFCQWGGMSSLIMSAERVFPAAARILRTLAAKVSGCS